MDETKQKSEAGKQLITGDMIIANIVEKYPLAAEIMGGYGLSCIGCHANPYESIEAGAAGHGMTNDKIQSMIQELNELATKGEASNGAKEAQEKQESKEEGKEEITPIVVTEIAVNKVKSIMESQKKEGYGLKVGAKAGGCAGFTYLMDFEKNPAKGDTVLEFDGLKVFVDPQSAKALSGVEIDYLETLTESGFKFNNPGAHATCGCGKSFS